MVKSSRKKSPSQTKGKTVGAKAKGTKSRRKTSSVDSMVKGRVFEDEVADLYRLQGAEVIQNIEINHKKVDILATFRYPVVHRVIIECKDEKRARAANQRVMQFHGLLDIARKTGEADSAEIITRTSWGDAAKGFAHKAGIRLLTYQEKLASLIDFTRYLKELVLSFESRDPRRPSDPPLGKYYVDLSAEVGNLESPAAKARHIPVIDTYINEWLAPKNGKRMQLSIFGEYGSGKSSLCQKLAHDLAASYLKGLGGRIPILLNLRVFIGKFDMDAYVTSFLDRECKVPNPKFELFKAMNDAGKLLLICDGFDEMATKVDADILESNLIEIEKLAASPKSKLILTSRPEYFTSIEEERHAMIPGTGIFRNREVEYQPVRLLPWNNDQVETFLRQRVPLVKEAKRPWIYYRDKIRNIGSLSDLAHRPVLLDMIVKTLPKLIETGIVINLPNLYRTYLMEEIRRQKVLKKRELLLTDVNRLALLEQLAVDFYYQSIPAITFQDALLRVEQQIKPPKQELEAYTRDFLTNSFLIRKKNDYQFSHKSILEYLVAQRLSEEIRSESPDKFGRQLLQQVIIDFLKEFAPDTKTLWSWIHRTRTEKAKLGKYLGGNAATILNVLSNTSLAGMDLSRTNLTGANLTRCDLRGANFRGAILVDARLTDAKFFEVDLAKAKTPLGCSISFIIDEDGVNKMPEDVSLVLADVSKQFPEAIQPNPRQIRSGAYIESIRDKRLRQAHLDYRHTWEGGPTQINKKDVIMIDIVARNREIINAVRNAFSRLWKVAAAVYADEVDRLLNSKSTNN